MADVLAVGRLIWAPQHRMWSAEAVDDEFVHECDLKRLATGRMRPRPGFERPSR